MEHLTLIYRISLPLTKDTQRYDIQNDKPSLPKHTIVKILHKHFN